MAARIIGRLGGMGKALFTTPAGWATLGTAGIGNYYLQQQFGTGKDFFHHKFTTTKDPDKIVDFYSTEEFLQILGIFKFATDFVLAGVVWSTDTDQKNTVWNAMEISFDITEREMQTADGKTVVAFFNKRERFQNYIPYTDILLWDQVQNYGYRRKQDGTIEVQHHGERFYGPWPVRLAVQLHAQYVIWATEKHINSPLFGSEDVEAVEAQRENIPAFALKEFVSSLRKEQEKSIAASKLNQEDTTRKEETLQKLTALEAKATKLKAQVTVSTRGEHLPAKGRLQRMNTVLHVDDAAAKDALQSAMADQRVGTEGGTEGGRAAIQGLLKTSKTMKA